jgi:predicted nucleic acid-binding protein
VAYYLLGTRPFVDEARRFWRAVVDPIAPASWEAEFANVVWMAIRMDALPIEEGPKRLELAGRLGIQSVPTRTLWKGALARAARSSIAVYDTLFVELAGRERLLLATFDKRLLAGFPQFAQRPGALISG